MYLKAQANVVFPVGAVKKAGWVQETPLFNYIDFIFLCGRSQSSKGVHFRCCFRLFQQLSDEFF